MLVCSIVELAVPQILAIYMDSFENKKEILFLGFNLAELDAYQMQLIFLPLAMILFAILRFFLVYLKVLRQGELGQKSLMRIRQKIYHTVQNSSFSYHDTKHTGTLISNLIEDVRYSTQFIEIGLFTAIDAAIFVLVLEVVLFYNFWYVAVASILTLFLGFVFTSVCYYFLFPMFTRTKVLFAGMVADFTENMEGHLLVRAYGQKDQQSVIYDKSVETFHDATIKEYICGSIASHSIIIVVFASFTTTVASYIYYHQYYNIPTSNAELVFIFTCQTMLISKGREFSRCYDIFIRFCITANRLQEFFDTEGVDTSASNTESTLSFEHIEIKNLYFAYQKNQVVLKNINLSMKSGETLGIVGITGSGKSTLLHLLHTFYEPTMGEILVDGRNLFHLPKAIYGHKIAIVFQDTFLFSGSISANIAYGNPDASIDDIMEVARIAQAEAFILELPDAYDALIGERGTTLSGGQRQRIGIARALLKHPKLLILDDSTSALDTRTEQKILHDLHDYSEDLMTIIVTQRKNSLVFADRIVVMQDGEIVEQGSLKELDNEGTVFYSTLTHKDEAGDDG